MEELFNQEKGMKRKKIFVLSGIIVTFLAILFVNAYIGYGNYKEQISKGTEQQLQNQLENQYGEGNVTSVVVSGKAPDPDIKNPLTPINPRRSFLNSSGDEVAYIDHTGNIGGIGNLIFNNTNKGSGFFKYLGSQVKRITKIWASDVDSSRINATNITTKKIKSADWTNITGITSSQITDRTIAAIDIANNAINTSHIVDSTILTGDISTDTILAADIASGAIGASELGSSIVNTTHILVDTILAVDIASNAIGKSELGAAVVNVSHLVGDLGLRWANLTGYPTACADDQTITAIGDTITCTRIAGLNSTHIQDIYLLNTGDTATGNMIFTKNLTVNGTTLFVNTNGRVGIGTTSPGSKLDVRGAIRATDWTNITGLADSQISDTLTASNLVAGSSVVSNAEVDDDLTISSLGSVTWSALVTYPTACLANQTITTLGDTVTCSSISIKEAQISNFGSYAPTTRTLTAGSGLTGGGDLSADRTFTVGAGSGISVSADAVALSYGTSLLGWNNLSNYPSTCSASQYISVLGDTLTCASISIGASQVTAGTFGTGNYIFTSNLTVDTNTLFVNSGTDRVGIGTVSPLNKLDLSVASGTVSLGLGKTTVSGTTSIIRKDVDASPWNFDLIASASTIADNSDIRFFTYDNSTSGQKMVIKASTGNVGIGTTSPQSIGTGYTTLDIRGSNGGGARFGKTSAEHGVIYSDVSGTFVGSVSDIPTGIMANNSVKMTILSGGNVGIGTTVPDYKLQVADTTSGTDVVGEVFKNSNTAGSDAILSARTAGSSAGDSILSLGTTAIGSWGFGLDNSDSDKLKINWDGTTSVHTDAATGTNVLTLQTDGNVGIGTTTPSTPLEIYHTSGITARLTKVTSAAYLGFGNATNNTATINSLAAGGLVFSTGIGKTSDALTERIRIDSSGRVGIGTASPTHTLSVKGTLNATGLVLLGSNTATVEINSNDWDISTTGVITGASLSSTQLTDGGTISFEWVDAEVSDTLTIDGTGTVTWAALASYPSTCTASQYISALGDTSTCASISISDTQVTDAGKFLLATGDTATGNYTFDSPTFHIGSTANRVGIGTINPLSNLHTIGNLTVGSGATAGTVGNVQITSGGASPINNRLTFGTDGTSWKFAIAKNQAGTVSDLLTIQTDGNVGIGTSNPKNKLNVAGDANITGILYINSASNITVTRSCNTGYTRVNGWCMDTNGQLSTLRDISTNETSFATINNANLSSAKLAMIRVHAFLTRTSGGAGNSKISVCTLPGGAVNTTKCGDNLDESLRLFTSLVDSDTISGTSDITIQLNSTGDLKTQCKVSALGSSWRCKWFLVGYMD